MIGTKGMKNNLLILSILVIVAIMLVTAVFGAERQSRRGDKSTAESKNPLKCIDSDGGLSYYQKGKVVVYQGKKKLTEFSDVCAYGQKGNPDTMDNVNLLYEGYCFADRSGAGYIDYSCPNGCKDGVCLPDFENYPDFLVKENKLNALFVVGDQAPAEDVIAISDIIESLKAAGYIIEITQTKLASEVKNPRAQNMILVGRPTKWAGKEANKLINRFKIPELSIGQALLKIADNGKFYAVIVTGRDTNGPRVASTYLANWEAHPDLLKGTEVIIK